MPLHIVENDIVTMQVDAIVNSTNHKMIGYSGVDALIHSIGGPKFEEECFALKDQCFPGEAVHTNAYNLPCKYIIHTVGVYWHGGIRGEAAVLRSCYRSSLQLAQQLGCSSIAFPLLSAGERGIPIANALEFAVTTIREFLSLYSDMDVYLVLYGAVVKQIADTMFGDLESHVKAASSAAGSDLLAETLEEAISHPSESFVDMLYRYMREKNIDSPPQLYASVGINKATFSKLVSGGSKKPSKKTAVALAFGLQLSFEEAVQFLASAEIALSSHSKFDIIVSYFLKAKNYNLWDLDVQLYKYGCECLMSDS